MIVDAKFGNSKQLGVLENNLLCRKAFLNVIIPTTLIEARHLTIPQCFKGDVPIKSPLSDIRSHLETAQVISFSTFRSMQSVHSAVLATTLHCSLCNG